MPIFGCCKDYRNYEEDNTQATTTSETPQLIFTSTFTPARLDEYMLGALYGTLTTLR